jgi:hypothetical protein
MPMAVRDAAALPAQASSSSRTAGTYKMSEKSMLEPERCGYRSLATGCASFAERWGDVRRWDV